MGQPDETALAHSEVDLEGTEVEARATKDGAKEALCNRFEPESKPKRELYSEQFQGKKQ